VVVVIVCLSEVNGCMSLVVNHRRNNLYFFLLISLFKLARVYSFATRPPPGLCPWTPLGKILFCHPRHRSKFVAPRHTLVADDEARDDSARRRHSVDVRRSDESCRRHVDADGVSGGSVEVTLATVASADAVVVATETVGRSVDAGRTAVL